MYINFISFINIEMVQENESILMDMQYIIDDMVTRMSSP